MSARIFRSHRFCAVTNCRIPNRVEILMNRFENLDYFVCYRLDSISPAGVFSLEWNQLKKVQMPGKGAVWLVN